MCALVPLLWVILAFQGFFVQPHNTHSLNGQYQEGLNFTLNIRIFRLAYCVKKQLPTRPIVPVWNNLKRIILAKVTALSLLPELLYAHRCMFTG